MEPSKNPGGKLRTLVVGIKRRVFRVNDEQAAKADAEYQAQRKAALERTNFRCVFCSFRSLKLSDPHHVDDNHTNNAPENLVATCKLCHPYNHIGETARNGQDSGIFAGHEGPNSVALIRVPDSAAISAADFNHLQRAIAFALADPVEAEHASKLLQLLASKPHQKDLTHAIFGQDAKTPNGKPMERVNPTDFAAAMQQLTDDEYARRGEVLQGVRVIYHPNRLREWGNGWRNEQPAFADPAGWEVLLQRPLSLVTVQPAPVAPVDPDVVRTSEVLVDDDMEDDDD